MTTLVPPPTFKNVLVWVKPRPGHPGKYDVTTEPPEVVVTNQDTIVNYQIVDTDGYPIVFTGMTVRPSDNDQLSKETVSVDGKMLAFFDANTAKMVLNIKLRFRDKHGKNFAHDPQVQNNPEG